MMMNTSEQQPKFAYVGCFTTAKRKGHGKGIAVYRVDAVTGGWTLIQTCETPQNPGFLALSSTQTLLYASHSDTDQVSSYSVDRDTGKLAFLNSQPCGGDNSPHITIDPTDRYVIVCNGPGLAVLPVNEDGTLAPATDIVIPPGEPGPYRHEQNRAHPHQAIFDLTGRFMIVPDKGLDKIFVYTLDMATGKLVPNDPPYVEARYGAVPRHVVIHPTRPYAYVVNECGSSVAAYQWNDKTGELTPIQLVPSTPTTHVSKNLGAEIAVAPSGKFIFASNRGHNSIVTMAVDQQTGMLDTVAWEPTQGKTPRFFALSRGGGRLYAANQDGDRIVVFEVETSTGKLTPSGQIIETGTPTCILFTY